MWNELSKSFKGVRIRKGYCDPEYYQFPKHLLTAPISQTSKLIYMMLYDRTMGYSSARQFDEDGNIFIHYPLTELVEESGRSISAVKIALNELMEAGMLEKESDGFGRPNRLYVMVRPEFGYWID